MVKSILLLLLGVFLFFTSASALVAQEPAAANTQSPGTEKRALIKEFLEVTLARKSAMALLESLLQEDEKLMPSIVWEAVSGMAEVKQLSPRDQQELKDQLNRDSVRQSRRLRELFSKKIDFGQLIENLSYELYAKYFTEDELKDLIAFYGSQTGKKTIEVMPRLFAESMSRTAEIIKPKLTEIITELTTEESDRIKQSLATTKPKATAKPTTQKRTRKS
jgi:uncharacterized protein